MAGANLRHIMTEVPRALEVISHDDQNLAPIGRKKVSPARTRQRQGEFLSKLVSGDHVLDESAADVVRQYLDAHHARVR